MYRSNRRKRNPFFAAYSGSRQPAAQDVAAERKRVQDAKDAEALAKAAEMSPEEVLALQAKLAKAEKTVRSLTGGQADMERAAGIVERLPKSAWAAVMVVREEVFGSRYATVPFARIEDAIAKARPSAFKMVVAYEVLKALIEKELEERKAKMLETPPIPA